MSTFDQQGFLARHELDAWEDNIRKAHPDWFSLVDDLNREAMRVRGLLQPSGADNRQLLAVVVYYRALRSFQGSVLLAARGACRFANAGSELRDIGSGPRWLCQRTWGGAE